MKIKNIKSWSENLELTRPYTIAFKTTDSVENVFVEIELENGITGIGAANPSKTVVGESFEDCLSAVSENKIDWLIGKDIAETPGLCNELLVRWPKNPGARAAIDIALHDAFCNYLKIPLVKYLGQRIEKMATSITIGIMNVSDTLEEAQEYFDRDFKILKVKLGLDVEEDIERLVKLREKFGNSMAIRIDANQGYNSADLIKFFDRTKHLQVELNEQPLPATAISEMKALPQEIRATIAADESLISPSDALRLIDGSHACEIFNIKLMKCGGISQARKIISVAEDANIDLMWGCNDESIVSISAGLHVAFSSASTKYIDLDGSLDLARDVVSGGFVIEDGYMWPNGEPGLGVTRN